MTKVHDLAAAEEEGSETIKGGNDDGLLQWITSSKIRNLDLFLIGVTIVIGGQATGFNAAFDAGYGIAIANTLFTGFGFLCLSFCMAEMTSALPFSGGVYGFVRAFIHPWLGFLVASMELVLNLFYASQAVYSLALIPVSVIYQWDDGKGYGDYSQDETITIILNALIIYVIIFLTSVIGGRVFWGFNMILGFLVLALMFIYMFGSLPNVDFNKYAVSNQRVSPHTIFAYLASSSGNYLGIQYLPLMSKDVENPRKTVPRAMVLSMLFFILTSVGMITICCSQYPGITNLGGNVPYPLTYGFQQIFNINATSAKWLSIPGLFSIAFGFMFCYGRQSLSMAESGFLPKHFGWTTPYFGTPWVGLIIGVIFCFCLNILVHYNSYFYQLEYNLSLLAAYFVFVNACIAYIVFSYTYSSLAREFVSPLGKIGAVCAILVFSLCGLAIIWLDQMEIILIGVNFIVGSIYYFCFVAQHQVFSKEEQDNLFKAYVINANIAKKNHKKATHHNQTRTQQLSLSPQKSGILHASKKTDDEKAASISNRRGGPTRVSFAPDTKGSDFLNKEETPSNKIIEYISSSVKKLVEEDPLQKDLKIIQSGGLDANADSNQVSTSEAEV
mmetsp:Transcript_25991/g.28363  ORF Transcript_25991/g.28363 Transcript_25991/m.28363 type:complete len:613 (-) Transcript_25991:559-2397(-)